MRILNPSRFGRPTAALATLLGCTGGLIFAPPASPATHVPPPAAVSCATAASAAPPSTVGIAAGTVATPDDRDALAARAGGRRPKQVGECVLALAAYLFIGVGPSSALAPVHLVFNVFRVC